MLRAAPKVLPRHGTERAQDTWQARRESRAAWLYVALTIPGGIRAEHGLQHKLPMGTKGKKTIVLLKLISIV